MEGPPGAAGRENLFEMLVRGMPAGVLIWKLEVAEEPDSLTLEASNPAAAELLCMDVAAGYGRRMLDLFPDVPPQRREIYAQAARGEMPAKYLGEVDFRGGRAPRELVSLVVIPLPGRRVGVLFECLTTQKEAQRDARTLSSFLESIIENIPLMVFVKDAEHLRFERFNRAGEDLLGLSREKVLGKDDYEFFPKEQADFFKVKDREVLQSKGLTDIPEEPIQTWQGRRWLHTKKIPLCDEMGTPRYLLGISEDITARKEAETARKLAEETLLRAHRELEQRVVERTAALSKANAELTQEIADRRRAEEALRQSEEQLRQAQKMEAIGRLAGGVAHDFNNLLSVILSYSGMIVDSLPPGDAVRADVEQIATAGIRARDLTRQLLAFSRQQLLKPEVIDLGQIVMSLEPMLTRLLGEHIELRILPPRRPRMVKADPGQIEQIIMNLVVNARDAMPSGGKLGIETSELVLDEGYAREHVGVIAGRYVMLAVSDSGVGMDKTLQTRIFEPFFTTKDKGKGTGLGLSTVFGIVQQSGGHIWVYSEPNNGTTFKIYLPHTQESRRPGVGPQRRLAPGSDRGTETILLVEDEDQVRVLARDVLRRSGYDVIHAQSAAEAVSLSDNHQGRIHLLLTDVVMPQVGGPELARRLVPRRPDMKVLYMSGYTDDAIVNHGFLDSGIAFLEKPLTPDTLIRKVRETLDQATDPSAPG